MAECTCPPGKLLRRCRRHGKIAKAPAQQRWYANKKRTDPEGYQRYLERQRIYNQGYRRGKKITEQRLAFGAAAAVQSPMRPALAKPEGKGGAWLACCGRWWAVMAVPFVCPQCGQRYLEARP